MSSLVKWGVEWKWTDWIDQFQSVQAFNSYSIPIQNLSIQFPFNSGGIPVQFMNWSKPYSQSTLLFLRYSFLKNLTGTKSKVNVTDEVKFQNHKVSTTSYRLASLSFQVNWPPHSRDRASHQELSESELIELINSNQFRLSIPIQFQFRIFQFNSHSIQVEFQFNSWIDPSPTVNRPSYSWDTAF